MPGSPSSSRSRSTGGVITPRSSATSGSSVPSSRGDGVEQRPPGPAAPAPRARVGVAVGHRPVGDEAAEVVEPRGVEQRQRAPQALDPPAIPAPRAARPSRTAGCPTAGRGRENASGGAPATHARRWNSSGWARWSALLRRDVDRDVAEQPHARARPRSARSAAHSRSNRTWSASASAPGEAAPSPRSSSARARGTRASSAALTGARGARAAPRHAANAERALYGER